MPEILEPKPAVAPLLVDPPIGVWLNGALPDYVKNRDLQFPYSDYPRDFLLIDHGLWEFKPVPLDRSKLAGRIVDFWGEGRNTNYNTVSGFPNAYNINHQYQLVTNALNGLKIKIPNRIPTIGFEHVSVERYIPDHYVDILTLMGAPIIRATAQEMARLINLDPGSVIVTYGITAGEIQILEEELDQIGFVHSPLYPFKPEWKEISITPMLGFCLAAEVTKQATLLFQQGNMSDCAHILCSLQESSLRQNAAKKALQSFFAQDSVRNSYTIFVLGYHLNLTEKGRNVMNGYMNANVRRVIMLDYTAVKIVSNFSKEKAYLFTMKMTRDSWQYAYFADGTYLRAFPEYQGGQKFRLIPAEFGGFKFNLQSNFGDASSYVCPDGKVGKDSWQKAFFGTTGYLDTHSAYNGGQNILLIPVDGGELFQIQARWGYSAYLLPDGKVTINNYVEAYFGTDYYTNDPSMKAAALFSLEFE